MDRGRKLSPAEETRMSGEDVINLTVGRARVGIAGLRAVFERLKTEGRQPSKELAEELVSSASERNYVPDSAWAEYAKALLVEYRRFIGEDVPEERTVLSIKVLGAGCPRCERLTQDVMAALERLGVAADVEHVADPARIGEYGVMGTPALVVNGKVVAAGRTPSAKEIERMLQKGERDVR